MSKKSIFRPAALERLSSPEQLDQAVRITAPVGWLALVALMALILAALLWSLFAHIPVTVRAEGILQRDSHLDNNALELVLYAPLAEGVKVQPGMSVQIAPTSLGSAEYGFLLGTVRSVADSPIIVKGKQNSLGADELAQAYLAQDALIEIHVNLLAGDTPSGYLWSASSGPPFALYNGMLCQANILLGEQLPINLLLP